MSLKLITQSSPATNVHPSGGQINGVRRRCKVHEGPGRYARPHNQDGRISHQNARRRVCRRLWRRRETTSQVVKAHVDAQMQFVDLMLEIRAPSSRTASNSCNGRKYLRYGRENPRRARSGQRGSVQRTGKGGLGLCQHPRALSLTTKGKSVYVNNAMDETLHKYEAVFRRQIPGFDASKVVGASVGMFYADPKSAIAGLRGLARATASRLFWRTRLRCDDKPCVQRKRRASASPAVERCHSAARPKGSRRPCRSSRRWRFFESHRRSGQVGLHAANGAGAQRDP